MSHSPDAARPRVLLVATAGDWLGTARAPEAFAAAGFEPWLFAPQDSLARFSRHTKAHYLLDARTSLAAQATTIATGFHRLAPVLLVPCDDAAYDLLRHTHGATLPVVPDHVRTGLRKLVETSLGDPAGFADSVDKLRFAIRARELGLAAPRSIACAGVVDAQSFALEVGFPVVLKRSFSFGGRGVAICRDAAELGHQFARLAGSAAAAQPLLVQAHLDGATWYTTALAWRGEILCCQAVERIERLPRGPSTVARCQHDEAMFDATARLVRAFGMSGLIAVEFIKSGDVASAIEVNRRVMPGLHRAPLIGLDYLGRWANVLAGRPQGTRGRLDAGTSHVFVNFPMEWMRDPGSPYLIYHPPDAPVDDRGFSRRCWISGGRSTSCAATPDGVACRHVSCISCILRKPFPGSPMAANKVAIITAGGGMGADAARKLASDGFRVAILSSMLEQLQP